MLVQFRYINISCIISIGIYIFTGKCTVYMCYQYNNIILQYWYIYSIIYSKCTVSTVPVYVHIIVL